MTTETTTETENQPVMVPVWNIQALRDKVAAMNKRAAKLGCSPLVLGIDPEVVPVKRQVGEEFGYRPICEMVPSQACQIVGEMPKLNGWTLVASVQLIDDVTLVRTVPGCECPTKYRQATDWCDHCRSGGRGRKDVFVLHHEDGRYVQVGRSCIADFLGHGDANKMVWLAAAIREARDFMGEMEECGGGQRKAFWLEHEVLPLAAATIRIDGWVPRSAGGKGEGSTSGRVQLLISGPGKNASPDVVKWHKDRAAISDDDATATAAIEWAKALPEDGNEFLYNLRTLAHLGYIDARGFGLAVSMVSAYLRHIGEEIIRKRQQAESQWFGEKGKRADYVLTVTKAIPIETMYGTSILHLMVDQAGNVAKWKASNSSLDVGKTYTIRGTVKGHCEYKGVKQTELTRCEVKGETKEAA